MTSLHRETSGVLFSYYNKSQYHERCVPAPPVAAPTVQKPVNEAAPKALSSEKFDAVTQDKMWKQAVGNEKAMKKRWETHWGFLAEYDDKGNPKEVIEDEEEETTVFSNVVPNTNSGNYGNRLSTETAQSMMQMEHALQSHNRKKKRDRDIICY